MSHGGEIEPAFTESAFTPVILDEEPIVRSLGREAPRPLGALVATIVVLASIGLFLWSLVATWTGHPNSGFPLFEVIVAGLVVSTVTVYARRTFGYLIALIGAVAWLGVSILPLVPFAMVLLQSVTVSVMIVGAVYALAAVDYSRKPRF